MNILTSSQPVERHTHTPDHALRARYRRWAAAERERRQKDDYMVQMNRIAAEREAREAAA